MNEMKLSLEDEKYLNKLNRMNSLELLNEQKKKQVEMGIADANGDFVLYDVVEHFHSIIKSSITSRMKNN